jgi:hypothetical protein
MMAQPFRIPLSGRAGNLLLWWVVGQFEKVEGLRLFLGVPEWLLARRTDVVDVDFNVADEPIDDPVLCVRIEGKHGWGKNDGCLRSPVYIGVEAEDAINDAADVLAVGRIKLS